MISPELRSEAEERLRDWGLTPRGAVDNGKWKLVETYVADVLEYNKKINITAAKSTAEIMRRHMLDAWAAVGPLKARVQESAPQIADVGSGAGFIGIGIKILWPEAAVSLVESIYKKFCFLNWTGLHLKLQGLKPVHLRAERMESGGFDAVTARALAPLPAAVRTCLPLTRPGGWSMIYQSGKPDAAEPQLASALKAAGGTLEEPVPYRLPGESKDRYLAFFRRTS